MRGVIHKSLGVAAGLLLFIPASALAGHASVGADGIARYDASFGETNRVTVGEIPDPSGGKLVVFRDVFEITVGANCFKPIGTTSEARCLVDDGITRARAGLGNRDDRIEASATIPPQTFGLSVEGDLGDDTLLGTAQRDVLDGVGGNDVIRGRAGNDGLEGGTGADDVKGEGGDDVLNGNDGSGGDLLDCGETTDDDDFAMFNPGDTVFSNCERTQLFS